MSTAAACPVVLALMRAGSTAAGAQGCSCWLCNCNDFAAPPLPPTADTTAHSLRVFVDKSVVEAHLDARLSITTRAYPLSEEATHLALVNDGKRPVQVESATVWGMRSIYQMTNEE